MTARIPNSSAHPFGIVIGHRGEDTHAPENTMAAFRQAWRSGADMVEVDARRSRDGVLVISHDPTVDRCTDGHGAIQDLTLAQLERLDAGKKTTPRYAGERIPTLNQVLDWARGKVKVNIHINDTDDNYRHNAYPGIEDQVVAAVRSHHAQGDVLVSSFDRDAVERIKQANPDLQCGLLTPLGPLLQRVKLGAATGAAVALGAALAAGCAPLAAGGLALAGAAAGLGLAWRMAHRQALEHALQAKVDVLCPVWPTLDHQFVSSAHAAGKKVYPYVANAPFLVDRLVHAVGADGVITDAPERFTAAVAATWSRALPTGAPVRSTAAAAAASAGAPPAVGPVCSTASVAATHASAPPASAGDRSDGQAR